MHMLVIWIGFATSVLGASLLLFLLLRDSEDMPYILPLRSKGSVAFGLGRCKCFPTLTFHTSWSTLENSHSRDRRKALWRNTMISRVRNNDYKESWNIEKQNASPSWAIWDRRPGKQVISCSGREPSISILNLHLQCEILVGKSPSLQSPFTLPSIHFTGWSWTAESPIF